jgi:hypothetical protein
MLKRMLLMLAVVIALLGGLGFVIQADSDRDRAGFQFLPASTAVTTVVAKRETRPSTLNVIERRRQFRSHG